MLSSPQPYSTTFLPHARGGVSVGDIMPKKEGPPPSRLGVLDHLHHLEMSTMRPYKLQKSERRRVVAICASSCCNFRLVATAHEGEYRVTSLAPHDCPIAMPRKNRKLISHLPWEAQQALAVAPLSTARGKMSSGASVSVQRACKKVAGVDVEVRQINRLRKMTVCNEAKLLEKLQILPSAVREIQNQLPAAIAILRTSRLGPQFHVPATRAFQEHAANAGVECEFVLDDEKSIQSLYFGESGLVRHLEKNIGHQVYTADAAHLDKPSVGFSCIVMLVTRRLGTGKVLAPAWCLTVLTESESTWSSSFNFCIKLGMHLNHTTSIIVSDMGKGLIAACDKLRAVHRECLTHIFHRLQDDMHVFKKGKKASIGAFFSMAKATTQEEERYHRDVLRRHHIREDKADEFLPILGATLYQLLCFECFRGWVEATGSFHFK